nr:hypothetical protein [Tanacetum cinerariifolium]
MGDENDRSMETELEYEEEDEDEDEDELDELEEMFPPRLSCWVGADVALVKELELRAKTRSWCVRRAKALGRRSVALGRHAVVLEQ